MSWRGAVGLSLTSRGCPAGKVPKSRKNFEHDFENILWSVWARSRKEVIRYRCQSGSVGGFWIIWGFLLPGDMASSDSLQCISASVNYLWVSWVIWSCSIHCCFYLILFYVHKFLLYCYYYSVIVFVPMIPVSAYTDLAFVFGFIQINWRWWWWWSCERILVKFYKGWKACQWLTCRIPVVIWSRMPI